MRPPEQAHDVLENEQQAERHEELVLLGAPVERTQEHRLDDGAGERGRQRAGDQQHEEQAHVELGAGQADRPRRHVRADGVEIAVGHVHDPHHAVDEREPGGDEEEDRRVEE